MELFLLFSGGIGLACGSLHSNSGLIALTIVGLISGGGLIIWLVLRNKNIKKNFMSQAFVYIASFLASHSCTLRTAMSF